MPSIASTLRASLFHTLGLTAVVLVGCNQLSTSEVDTTAQTQQLTAYDDVLATLDRGDATTATTRYRADLAPAVQGLVGARTFVSERDTLGAVLNSSINGSLLAAGGAMQARANRQIVDKTLQRYLFEAMYAQLALGTPEGWARGTALSGVSATDRTGAASKGIGHTAYLVDQSSGRGFHGRIFDALARGRDAVDRGDGSTVQAALESIEQEYMTVFALAAQEALAQIAEAEAAGQTELALGHWFEGKIYWSIVQDYADAKLPDSGAAVASLKAQLVGDTVPAPPSRESIISSIAGLFPSSV